MLLVRKSKVVGQRHVVVLVKDLVDFGDSKPEVFFVKATVRLVAVVDLSLGERLVQLVEFLHSVLAFVLEDGGGRHHILYTLLLDTDQRRLLPNFGVRIGTVLRISEVFPFLRKQEVVADFARDQSFFELDFRFGESENFAICGIASGSGSGSFVLWWLGSQDCGFRIRLVAFPFK